MNNSFEMLVPKSRRDFETPWEHEIQQRMLELESRKSSSTSILSHNEFIEGMKSFDCNTAKDYWTVCMKSYSKTGELCSTQYLLYTAPKYFSEQDYLRHYDTQYHKDCFLGHKHEAVNEVYLVNNTNKERTLLLIYLV